jgi:hypothetical protein
VKLRFVVSDRYADMWFERKGKVASSIVRMDKAMLKEALEVIMQINRLLGD